MSDGASEITLERAVVAAARLHEEQRDKGGEVYLLHPLRVMLAVKTDKERIVALLHDAAEDAGWEALRGELGELPGWLERDLDALTRRSGEPYEAFIERVVAASPRARAVKVADLRDNVRLERLPGPPSPQDLERCEKYRRALRALEESP